MNHFSQDIIKNGLKSCSQCPLECLNHMHGVIFLWDFISVLGLYIPFLIFLCCLWFSSCTRVVEIWVQPSAKIFLLTFLITKSGPSTNVEYYKRTTHQNSSWVSLHDSWLELNIRMVVMRSWRIWTAISNICRQIIRGWHRVIMYKSQTLANTSVQNAVCFVWRCTLRISWSTLHMHTIYSEHVGMVWYNT